MSNYYKEINFIHKTNLGAALDVYKTFGDTRSHKIFYFEHPKKYPIDSSIRFQEAIFNSFPLDPLLEKFEINDVFFARLTDSLHGGIRDLEEELIDIIWQDVDLIAQNSISILIYGINFLDYVLDGFVEANGNRYVTKRLLMTYRQDTMGFSKEF